MRFSPPFVLLVLGLFAAGRAEADERGRTDGAAQRLDPDAERGPPRSGTTLSDETPTPGAGADRPAPGPEPRPAPAPGPDRRPAGPLGDERRPAPTVQAKSFAYQLQNVDAKALAASKFELFVIEPARDGDEDRLSAADVASIRKGPAGSKPRTVLAYLSIGEAEDYRSYWEPAWDKAKDGKPDAGAPAWLDRENPDWKGNYKVRYWEPAWQKIVFAALDRIIDAEFNGVYLDIIDAYEYYAPKRPTAERDMVDFVKRIAAHARTTRGKADFLVFPQNGEGLARHDDFVAAVSGIGIEDLFYTTDEKQDPATTAGRVANIDRIKNAGKLVLNIDYPTKPTLVDDFYARSKARGYVPYRSTRALDTLSIGPRDPR